MPLRALFVVNDLGCVGARYVVPLLCSLRLNGEQNVGCAGAKSGAFTMTDLDNDDVIQQLREGESDRVEFKESLRGDAPNRIREAICAFANDLPDHRKPGVVFVGVRDDGTVTGLSVTDELLRQLADMKTDGNIVPPPSLTVERRSVSGNDVAVIAVQPSDSPPVRYNGRVHVRIGSRRGTATAQDERILNEKRRYRDIPFDIQPIPSATLSDLNLPQFEHEYLTQAFSPDILEANERSTQEQLAATKMTATAEEPLPTVLGILMIGKNPQDFLPGSLCSIPSAEWPGHNKRHH